MGDLGSRKLIEEKLLSFIPIGIMVTLNEQPLFLRKFKLHMRFCLIPRNERGTTRIVTRSSQVEIQMGVNILITLE